MHHFHYTTWPDFGVPQSPLAFLHFLMVVRRSGALDENVGPPVVHCSAGIGRSGTFCLVDLCLLLVICIYLVLKFEYSFDVLLDGRGIQRSKRSRCVNGNAATPDGPDTNNGPAAVFLPGNFRRSQKTFEQGLKFVRTGAL